jgi:prevent-host-death family protein
LKTVNIHDAKTHFSRLIKLVESGDEVVIARGGKPIARLVPCDAQVRKRTLGADSQTVRIAADFDAPVPDDLLDDFDS